MQVRNEGHKSIITYRVSVQTNSIIPISPYMIEFFLVQIRDDDKSLLCHKEGIIMPTLRYLSSCGVSPNTEQ